jgi:GT2 family glycosyltransferase
VDNASETKEFEQVKNWCDEFAPGKITVVRNSTNLGFAAGNNLGLLHTEGVQFVALLNPDAYAAKDWLERFVVGAKSSANFDFWGCSLRLADTPELFDGTGDVYHVSGFSWRRDHGIPVKVGHSKPDEIFGPCAAAALYTRNALQVVGGFDESFFCYHEDVDLAFRLRLLGYRCGFVPDAFVDHVSSGISGRNSDFATYHGHRNLIWTYFKNMPIPMFWFYLPLHIFMNLISVIHCAFRGQFKVVLKAKLDAIKGLPHIIRQRSELHKEIQVNWQELRLMMSRRISSLWHRY